MRRTVVMIHIMIRDTWEWLVGVHQCHRLVDYVEFDIDLSCLIQAGLTPYQHGNLVASHQCTSDTPKPLTTRGGKDNMAEHTAETMPPIIHTAAMLGVFIVTIYSATVTIFSYGYDGNIVRRVTEMHGKNNIIYH